MTILTLILSVGWNVNKKYQRAFFLKGFVVCFERGEVRPSLCFELLDFYRDFILVKGWSFYFLSCFGSNLLLLTFIYVP